MIGERKPHRATGLESVDDRDFPRGLWSPAPPAAIVAGEPAAIAGNAFTFILTDSQDLISASIEAQITLCANYVISLISHYLSWQGTLDFTVDIKPASASPYPEINGVLPTVGQIAWNGSAWVNQTLEECLTGTDSNISLPDAGCTIFLASDGTIRNYNAPVWFDPNPQFALDPDLPAGQHDFVGIYTHEIFHSLGFYEVTQQWRQHITTQGPIAYFEGPAEHALYGGALPFEAERDHYGYTQDPSIGITRGLMFQFGNYEGNRLDIGRIDLAVLADLGHAVKGYDGLPLFELIDNQLDLAGGAGNDRLYGDYHANVLTGAGGADRIEGGAGADRLNGGAGFDRLAGGADGDVFVFASPSDSQNLALRSDGAKFLPDAISDFHSGEDKIDLSAIDAIAGTAGNDAFTFIGTGAFTGHAGELRYAVSGGVAHIFADLDGNGSADFTINAITPILIGADFVL